MNLGLDGKRALVLAASSGLGRATALELAREGARVALCSRDLERARSAADAIGTETGAQVEAYAADVSDAGSLTQLFAAVGRDLGGLDILVCNAGGPPPGGFGTLEEAKWETAYQLTLQSVVRSVRLALPLFDREAGAAVLAIGSSSVERPIPNLLLSNVFRPAVWALCNHLATELASDNVRVNMLSPGRILTGRTEQLDRARAERSGLSLEAVRAASVAAIPLGRLGDPAEFGRVAAFLCSEAASYITGSSLLVDGGMVENL